MSSTCCPQKILANLTNYPGVYQMLDAYGKILYIGKAKNLKNRVSQYFNKSNLSSKTIALMAKVCSIEVSLVSTESQALLLENDLIKIHKPRYNILLKDDKSYPYIHISKHKHPKVSLYRGEKKNDGQYFGPFASAYVVKESLALLKKIFQVRQCANSVYANRSRPCLEHQLSLCSAPCVDKISPENYAKDVAMMTLFLTGKSQDVLAEVSQKMQTASKDLDFELAAHYRDQLQQLNTIQSSHLSNDIAVVDVIAVAEFQGLLCIQIAFIRNNRQIGQLYFYPKNPNDLPLDEVLSAFLPLYYLGRIVPKEMVVSHKLADKDLLADTLKTRIISRVAADKKQYLHSAKLSALSQAKQLYQKRFTQAQHLDDLQKKLNLACLPVHIECFDISHMMGEATIASCVVFIGGKPAKSSYRRFNITDITGGDDYAAIKQAVTRRYSRLQKEQKTMPNLLLIDGGLGQLSQAIAVIKSLDIDLPIVGVAKGEGRKAGLETLIMVSDDGEVLKIKLKPDDSTLMFVNHIRDESHRFAIAGHRQKLKKIKKHSVLENIAGIGSQKRTAILNHFGGLQKVKTASINEISKISGINTALATKIYQSFRKL